MQKNQILKKIAFFSIPIAIIIFLLKYWAYLMTGSVALYSDALESLVNILSAVLVWWSIHISYKPPDHGHPFGHYKAEYFSAGLISMLVIASAGTIFYVSIKTMIRGEYILNFSLGTFITMGATSLNIIWAFILLRFSKLYRSQALKADAKHILSDVITSVSVLLGLSIAYFTKWYILDPLIAIFAAMNILWEGWKIFSSSINGLMDAALSHEEIVKIQQIIAYNAKGALEAHDLKTRKSGSAVFLEFHLVVDSKMSVYDSHLICDTIEDALRKEIPYAHIVIHVEPEGEAKLPIGTQIIPFA